MLQLLDLFGSATGLCINPAKSSMAPIRCQGINLDAVLQDIAGKRVGFPITYLGLPVTLGRLRRVHLQFVFDRIMAKLAAWKGRLLNHAERRALVHSVLSAIPIFALAAIHAPVGFFKDIDKISPKFLWAHEGDLIGGKCKVNWASICSPIDLGGLGIHNMDKFARAPRLHWLWLSWASPQRPWVGSKLPCDQRDRDLFAAATTISINNGEKARYWESTWLDSSPLRCTAPPLFSITKRKNRSVKVALSNS